jgi:hypothetical protein
VSPLLSTQHRILCSNYNRLSILSAK